MPGDEHVADGRVGARTVGAEADVVVVIVRLPPPPQPTRTGGPCYRVAANLWFLLLRAAARPRDSRVSEPQPQHRRLLPATQETSLRPGAKGGHGDGGHRRRAAEGPRGPRAGWNLTSREARDQARSADFGRWGGSPATSKGSSSRSDFGERAGARRDGIHYGPNHPPLIFITTAIEGELYLPEEEIGTSIPSPPASSPSVGASSAVPAQAGRCSLAPGVAPLGHCVRRQPPLVWPGSPMVPSSASNRGEGEKEMPPAGLAPRACSRSGGESDRRGARGTPSWQLCSGARRAGRRCGSSSSSVLLRGGLAGISARRGRPTWPRQSRRGGARSRRWRSGRAGGPILAAGTNAVTGRGRAEGCRRGRFREYFGTPDCSVNG